MINDNEQHRLDIIRQNNQPRLNEEAVLALRAVTEKRASTIANILDEAKKLGIDDGFVRQAIYRYGADNGKAMANSLKNPDDLNEFAQVFTSGLEVKVYEMELIEQTEQKMTVHFHYCPYVNKWLEQGRTPNEMATFCDICMEGDEALATAFNHLGFKLGNTIAKGNSVCEISYFKES